MSFGWSGSDVFLLARLAWNTVQNARKACGEYDELTRETLRLHAVLQRLAQEVAKQESPINRPGETSKEQLERIAIDCEVVLRQLDKIVTEYASLSEEKRSVRKIWQRVRFGNGQVADLRDIRSKLMSYTSEMLLYLNLVSMSTVGRIEQRMNRDEGVLRDIKIAVEKKTAHTVLGGNKEGSVWTTYTSDDTGFWRGLRRDLVKDGLPSAAIHKHKRLIKKYVKELGARGILDESPSIESDQPQQDVYTDAEIIEEVEDPPDNHNSGLNIPREHNRNVGIQPLEDVRESIGDSTNPALAEGIDESFPVVSDAGNDNDPSSKSRSSIVDISGDPDSNDTFPPRSEEHRSATYQHESERPSMPDHSSGSPKDKAYFGASSSSREEAQRSATYQPSHRAKHPQMRRSETMPVDRIRPKNPVPSKSSNLKDVKAPSDTSNSSSESDSLPSRGEAHRSADYSTTDQSSPNADYPLLRRSATMPVDRMWPKNPVFFKSSNLKNMKAPSDTSDGRSEPGSPPPRPPFIRRTTSGMAQEGIDPEAFQSNSKESHRISQRPFIGARERPTRSPQVDKRRPGLSRNESGRVTPSKSRDSGRNGSLFGEAVYEHDTLEVDKAPYKSGGVWICPDSGSMQAEGASTVASQGSSPEEDRLNELDNELEQKVYEEYEQRWTDYLFKHPPNGKEENDFYPKLAEIVEQHIISVDAVSVKDKVAKYIKKQMILDAQEDLTWLDKVKGIKSARMFLLGSESLPILTRKAQPVPSQPY